MMVLLDDLWQRQRQLSNLIPRHQSRSHDKPFVLRLSGERDVAIARRHPTLRSQHNLSAQAAAGQSGVPVAEAIEWQNLGNADGQLSGGGTVR